MRRILPATVIFCAAALVLASCGKFSLGSASHTSAIRLTVSNVKGSKASVITTGNITDGGFKISAYVTEPWTKDLFGAGTQMPAGIFTDPGSSEGSGSTLQDVLVTYNAGRIDPWRITGNDGADYAGHKYSWVNNKAMYFFSYAPAEALGRTILKEDTSTDKYYPFSYKAPVNTDGYVVSSGCADLIFAFSQNTAEYDSDQASSNFGLLKPGSKGKIDIYFYHAMAQIRFCLSTEDGTYDPSYKLVSVKLKGINREGGCIFDGSAVDGSAVDGDGNKFRWDTPTTQADYFQTFNNAEFEDSTPSGWTKKSYNNGAYYLFTNTEDVFFVIPQELDECKVEVTISKDGSTTTLTGKLPATDDSKGTVSWEEGLYYTYKIGTKGKGENISLDMTLADWAEREHYIPID